MSCLLAGPRAVKRHNNKVGTHHLLFVVGYVTFQTAYAIALTFTVLLLLMELSTRFTILKNIVSTNKN